MTPSNTDTDTDSDTDTETGTDTETDASTGAETAIEPEPGTEIDVRELETIDDVRRVFPILNELRDHLDEEQYVELYEEMAAEGYTVFACYADADPVAVAGVKITTNFYLGRHAYVYDLVTTERERSKGYGEHLLSFVHEWAAERDCEAVELESGLWRDEAHEFYERVGYEKYCYSFTYDLS